MLRLLTAFWLLFSVGFALDVPPLKERVTDLGGFLTSTQRQSLEEQLAGIEKATSNQIAVLTIDSLEGDALEDYSLRVAESWKLGQKGKDNGVLILLVKESRDIRIEVGYGLEGSLPDSLAGTIIRQEIVPHMREGDPLAALSAAVKAIDAATKGEYVPEPESEASNMNWLEDSFIYIVIFFVVFLPMFTRMNRWLGAGVGGIVGFLLLMSAGYLLGLLGFALGAFFGAIADKIKFKGGSGGGGFSSGGSSSGGGGFSGGGGSFGGGGSSGRW